jgi:hypothetical protein
VSSSFYLSLLTLMSFSCDINKSIYGNHIPEILILSFLTIVLNQQLLFTSISNSGLDINSQD